ncbi:hypothetical protein HD806DRAFT_26405 [Xylariaceae sp. AK1471]|nr:hypothetical protein HD806DRAFT_26405 [Xylariaceae sp. AK1471]
MPAKDNLKLEQSWYEKLFKRHRAASPVPSATQSTEFQSSKQEVAEHRPEASSIIATETCNAQATCSSTDTKATAHHRSAVTSRAPPPALPVEPQAEPVALKSVGHVVSASERLWNAAYDSLEKDDAELVGSYVKTLEQVLGGETHELSAADLSAKLKDPTTRQMHMRELVQKGQEKISKASRITNGVGEVADFILSAKTMIDTVLQSVPQAAPAALPWAGVCLGLQMLRNPAHATNSNLAGISHVISRMDWYCALTEHLLKKENIVAGNDFDAVLRQLKERVTELYKALLLYQMKSVCSYYRNQGLVFLRGMLNLDDWDGDLKCVTDAEMAVRDDAAQYFQQWTKTSLVKLVKHAEGMETRLGDIYQTLQDFISLQKDARKDDMEAACRRGLRVVDPQHDMMRIENSKDELLDDAYKWILRTPEYTAFTTWEGGGPDCPPHRLLWIKGHAGTGKTMLMIGIIRELSLQPVALTPALSFFFCQSTDTTLNNATAVLRSLIWLLLFQQPYLISHLLQKYKESGADLFEDKNAFYALSEAFYNMLKDPRLSPVYLAIDALDECGEGREDLIHLISTCLTLSHKVKWLLSSRPEFDVLAELKNQDTDLPDFSETPVELNTQCLMKPVNAYIDHKLKTLKRKIGYNDGVLADILCEVRRRAENTFLWVSLAFKALKSVHGGYAVKRIREMPPGLSDLYDHMMTRIETGGIIDTKDCKNVLVATALAFRPLSVSELAVLADLPLDMVVPAVETCGSFLTITGETVNLIHQSAKDYLYKNYTTRLRPTGVAQGHADISSLCIRTMKKTLYRDICKVEWPGTLHPSIDPQIISDKLARIIQYACQYWADHIQQAEERLYDDGAVHDFLKQHFLHWLEALSLIGKASESLRRIEILQSLCQPESRSQLLDFVDDALRFTRTNVSTLQAAPLQTYCSALAFAPEKSIIRQTFRSDVLRWMSLCPNVDMHWSNCLQTLDRHDGEVSSVAFSPDGTIIASASGDNGDNKVRLWLAATGQLLRILEGHGKWVNSVAFSPDGTIIASASDDSTVRLWLAATGKWLRTLNHGGEVRSVAFSSDGLVLGSASSDKTVRLWSVATGELLRALEGHDNYVNSVAFSPDPDSTVIASASDDNTVQLWLAATGEWLRTLKDHDGEVKSVAFSPNGLFIASASSDKTVRLWRAATGEWLRTFKGHGSEVRSVAFSPDSLVVASASRDRTVRLWSSDTGTLLQTLDSHVDWVNSVAFFRDGKVVASGSSDKTVRLWLTATNAQPQTLKSHSDCVKFVAFSHDGLVVASASSDQTVRLWSAATGDFIRTLEGHSDKVEFVAFSPDCTVLASASRDNTVRFWSVDKGNHLGSIGLVTASYPLSIDWGGRRLLTDAGAISFGHLLQPTQIADPNVRESPATSLVQALPFYDQNRQLGYGISKDCSWITKDGKNLVWLPANCRPGTSAVFGSTVAIGSNWGRVIIMRFQPAL